MKVGFVLAIVLVTTSIVLASSRRHNTENEALDILAAFDPLHIYRHPHVTVRQHRQNKGRGWGLFVEKEISSGGSGEAITLVTVPRDAVLAGRTLEDLRRVIHKELVDADSPWMDYLSSLPRDFEKGVPVFLPEDVATSCLSTQFLNLYRAKHEGGQVPNTKPYMKKQRRAYGIAHTRAIRFGNQNFVVTPLIDYANHAPRKEATAELVFDPDGTVHLKTTVSTLRPNDEITIDYGIRSPVESVDQFGFLNLTMFDGVPAHIGFPKKEPFPSYNCTLEHKQMAFDYLTGAPTTELMRCLMITVLIQKSEALNAYLAGFVADDILKKPKKVALQHALDRIQEARKLLFDEGENNKKKKDCSASGAYAEVIGMTQEADRWVQTGLYRATKRVEEELSKL